MLLPLNYSVLVHNIYLRYYNKLELYRSTERVLHINLYEYITNLFIYRSI
jgi:hypothetical protein